MSINIYNIKILVSGEFSEYSENFNLKKLSNILIIDNKKVEVNKMAQIKITTGNRKTINVKGNLTFTTELLRNEVNEEYILVRGQMVTHKYIEDIFKIETHRYLLSDIKVYRETFGSDDFNILYEFEAKDYTIKNGATNLSNELIEEIEKELYALSDSNKWEGDDE